MMAWIGTALQIIGAVSLAGHWVDPYWAYALMLPGAAIWALIGVWRADFPMIALQGTFTLIDLYGLFSWSA